MEQIVLYTVLALIILLVIFLIFREFFTWYWKINKTISVLNEINLKLDSIVNQNNNKNEKKDKCETEKKLEKPKELNTEYLEQAKKDYKEGKCPECGEKINRHYNKCFICGYDLSKFE
jgi:F0F1-type ATP synthase membrane subunit b/b'